MEAHAQGPPPERALLRSLNLFDVALLGFSSAVGVSIFSVLSPATAVAGGAMVWSIIFATVPMLVFALIYAFLSSALPRSGAAYDWPRLFLSPSIAFFSAWLRIVGNVGAIIATCLVFVQYLEPFAHLPEKPTMLLLIAIVTLINVLGTATYARAQRILVAALLVVLAAYVGAAVTKDPWATAFLIDSHTPGKAIAAIPLLVGLFMGIEASVEVGGEVQNPMRNVPLGIGFAVVMALVVYVAVAAVTLAALGPQHLAHSDAPLVQVALLTMGRWAAPAMAVAVSVALLKSLNATFIVFSRFLYAMGASGALPTGLARVHPRWRTPHVAVLTVAGLSSAGLCLPGNLIFLLLAVNIPTLLKYLVNCLAAARLVTLRPDLHAKAYFRLPPRLIKCLAWLGSALAVLICIAGLEADWKPYALLGAWGVAGLLYWVMSRARRAAPEMTS